MNKNFKPVYIRGTETGKGVIEALKARGGINNFNHEGNCKSNLYYISPGNNFIRSVDKDNQFALYIKATAEEIKPLRWRAGCGERYYVIESGMTVVESTDYRDKYDELRYESRNYFKTKEEAENKLEKIKKILLSE